ncbi:hypothetical protein DL96DRAFT_826364 [Flagelloscypha sp. PMI_526]|nr:hypothetical protein DL96DRAFT_826364 [Flagelloscypha sp. PMI_526]
MGTAPLLFTPHFITHSQLFLHEALLCLSSASALRRMSSSVNLERSALEQRILTLTTILAYQPASTYAHDASSIRNPTIWNNVATLLSIGVHTGSNDHVIDKSSWKKSMSRIRHTRSATIDSSSSSCSQWSWPAVAVGGHLNQLKGADCTVVVSQESGSGDDSVHIQVRELKPNPAVLQHPPPPREGNDLEHHVEEMFTVLEGIMSRKIRPSYKESDRLLKSGHRRFFPKAALRLLVGHRVWRTHPVDILEHWDCMHIQTSQSFSVTSPLLVSLLSSRNIHSSSNGLYLVDATSAKLWISAFVEAYRRMERVLFSDVEDLSTIAQSSSWERHMTSLNAMIDGEPSLLDILISCMIFFREILTSRPFGFIMNQSSLVASFEAQEIPGPLRWTTSSRPSDPFELKSRGVGEKGTAYVFRYFNSICAFASSIFNLTHSPPCLSLRARMVTVSSPTAHISSTMRDDVKDKLIPRLANISLHEIATEFIEKRTRHPLHRDSTTIHAQSALVALMHEANECNSQSSLLNPDDKACLGPALRCQEIMIAPNERCCWCCWRLNALLRGCTCPNVQVSGCHDSEIIIPWRPPPFGIPLHVLQTMENHLLDLLGELIVRQSSRHSYDGRRSTATPFTTYHVALPPPKSSLEKFSGKPDSVAEKRGFWRSIRRRTASLVAFSVS